MGPFDTHPGSSPQLPLLSTPPPPPASPLTKTKYLLFLRNGGRCGFLLLLTLPLPRIRAGMGNIYPLLRAGPCSKGLLSIWSFHFYNPTKVRVIIISVLQRGPWRRESKMTQLEWQHKDSSSGQAQELDSEPYDLFAAFLRIILCLDNACAIISIF